MDEPTRRAHAGGGRPPVRRRPRADRASGIGRGLHQPPARRGLRRRRPRHGPARRRSTSRTEPVGERRPRRDLIEMMVGRRLDQEFPPRSVADRPDRGWSVRGPAPRARGARRVVRGPPRRGARPDRAGGLRPHRDGPPDLRRRPPRRRHDRARRPAARHPRPARRHPRRHRPADRGPQGPGADPRPTRSARTSACPTWPPGRAAGLRRPPAASGARSPATPTRPADQGRRARSSRPATCPAATSRRWCWPSG